MSGRQPIDSSPRSATCIAAAPAEERVDLLQG